MSFKVTSLTLGWSYLVIAVPMKQSWIERVNAFYESIRIMTSSNGNIFRVIGPSWGEPLVNSGFPSQRTVTRSFDIFFDLCIKKRLSKQSRRRWFETPSLSLWRYVNVTKTKQSSRYPCENIMGYTVKDEMSTSKWNISSKDVGSVGCDLM